MYSTRHTLLFAFALLSFTLLSLGKVRLCIPPSGKCFKANTSPQPIAAPHASTVTRAPSVPTMLNTRSLLTVGITTR